MLPSGCTKEKNQVDPITNKGLKEVKLTFYLDENTTHPPFHIMLLEVAKELEKRAGEKLNADLDFKLGNIRTVLDSRATCDAFFKSISYEPGRASFRTIESLVKMGSIKDIRELFP